MRVLITGGAGYLGAWIIRRLLDRGFGVRVLDMARDYTVPRSLLGTKTDRVEWIAADVSDGDAVRAASNGCQAIIHLAALLTPFCRADPIRGAMINVIGTLNVFEAAKLHGMPKVLYTSSAAIFGTDDIACPTPMDHYSAAKLSNEGSARAYWRDEGIASFALRPLVIYGPERVLGGSAGVSIACKAAARGEAYDIPFTGSSGFIFADDVAAAFEAALLSSRDGASSYNFWGQTASVAEVIDTIAGIVPGARITCSGNALAVPAKVDSSAIYADYPELSLTTLDRGLAQTVAFYQAARL